MKPKRSWLDRADHIAALLDSARQLDNESRACPGQRRALLAVLLFAGLRIGEALRLRWTDVDLARGTIKIRESESDAGVRTINLLPVLRDELDAYRAGIESYRDGYAFSTLPAGAMTPPTYEGWLAPAVVAANEALETAGEEPLPAGLTPHSLRRTFASLLYAIGEAPPYVKAQIGHETAGRPLEMYARHMDRRDGEPERLKALVEGAGPRWAPTSLDAASTSWMDQDGARRRSTPPRQAGWIKTEHEGARVSRTAESILKDASHYATLLASGVPPSSQHGSIRPTVYARLQQSSQVAILVAKQVANRVANCLVYRVARKERIGLLSMLENARLARRLPASLRRFASARLNLCPTSSSILRFP